jgi:hypothetical protein
MNKVARRPLTILAESIYSSLIGQLDEPEDAIYSKIFDRPVADPDVLLVAYEALFEPTD